MMASAHNAICISVLKSFDKQTARKCCGSLAKYWFLNCQGQGVTPCPWQFKNQYLAKLPQHLRAVCLSKDFSTLMQMAVCADAIMDLHGSRSQPSTSWSAAAVTPSDQHDLSNSNFRGEESGFQQVLASNFGGRGQFCFYHTRFGEKALKCVPPCNWSTQQPASNQNAPKSTRSGNLTRAGRR